MRPTDRAVMRSEIFTKIIKDEIQPIPSKAEIVAEFVTLRKKYGTLLSVEAYCSHKGLVKCTLYRYLKAEGINIHEL